MSEPGADTTARIERDVHRSLVSDAPPLVQTAFRLNSLDLELLDLVRARYCLADRTKALRFVLRWWKARITAETGP